MGYVEGVQLLVERGASLKARSTDGLTCLHNALEYGHQSIGAYLLKQQFQEIDARGNDGCCLLQHLVFTNDASLISSLKGKGVDFNTRCPVRSLSILSLLSGFVGWHYGCILCNKTWQEQGTERTIRGWG